MGEGHENGSGRYRSGILVLAMAMTGVFHLSPSGCGGKESVELVPGTADQGGLVSLTGSAPAKPMSRLYQDLAVCPEPQGHLLSPVRFIVFQDEVFRFVSHPSDTLAGVVTLWRKKSDSSLVETPPLPGPYADSLMETPVPVGPGDYRVTFEARYGDCVISSMAFPITIVPAPPPRSLAPARFSEAEGTRLEATSCRLHSFSQVDIKEVYCGDPFLIETSYSKVTGKVDKGGEVSTCIEISLTRNGGTWTFSQCFAETGCRFDSVFNISRQEHTGGEVPCPYPGKPSSSSSADSDSQAENQVGYTPPDLCPGSAREGPPRLAGGDGGAALIVETGAGGLWTRSRLTEELLGKGVTLNGVWPVDFSGTTCSGSDLESEVPVDCLANQVTWELPLEENLLRLDGVPPGRVVTPLGGTGTSEQTDAEVFLTSPQVFFRGPPPAPAPDRPGELAPKRALSCEPPNPCQANQNVCENRVACLQNNWKTNPPSCLGPKMAECFRNSDSSRFACVGNEGDKNCGAGKGGYTNTQTNQSVICEQNAGLPPDRSLEISILHERVHQCDPTPAEYTPAEGLPADQRADSCELVCFSECGGADVGGVCGVPGPDIIPITPSQCEL